MSGQNKEQIRQEILDNCNNHTLYSWSVQKGLNPMAVERGEGSYFYDFNGKKYLDFSSQLVCNNIGYGVKEISDAIADQLSQVSFVHPAMISKARGELGKRIAELAPGDLNKTFFTLGGAEANENAIKFARYYTGKHKILARYGSYHGATNGAMSVSGDPRKFKVDGLMAGVVHFEGPYQYRSSWNAKNDAEECKMALDHLERVILFEGPETIAAIILEGESGSSGLFKHPDGYWAGIRKLADKYGFLIICDEVMSGFGRTGKWFAIEHHNVVPDMITFAKGSTAGYLPLGGVIVSDKISKKYDTEPLLAGLTYSAHPVCCAAGSAVIDYIKKHDLIKNCENMGNYMNEKIAELMKKHPSMGDYRSRGLFGLVELVKNRTTKEPLAPWNAKASEMAAVNEVAAKTKELGLYVFFRWNFFLMAPPLNVSKAEIDEAMNILDQALVLSDKHCV